MEINKPVNIDKKVLVADAASGLLGLKPWLEATYRIWNEQVVDFSNEMVIHGAQSEDIWEMGTRFGQVGRKWRIYSIVGEAEGVLDFINYSKYTPVEIKMTDKVDIQELG